MESSLGSERTRPPAINLDSYRGSQKTKRGVLHLLVSLVTISQRWMWQIILAIIPLVANAAAYNESRLAPAYQTLPGSRPSAPEPLSFQNSTNQWNMTNQDLSNGSTKSHPPWHAMETDPYHGNADHSSTDLATEAGFLSNHYRMKKASYLTSTSPEILGSSLQGSTSPFGITGTTDARLKGLHSSTGALAHTSLDSALHHSSNIFSSSLPTLSSDSSSWKTHSEHMTLHTGEELAHRVLPTSAGPETLFHFSVRSSGEVSSHLTLPALRYFTGSTTSRGFPTHHQAEPLSASLFQSLSAPTTVETHRRSTLSTSAIGTQLDAKHSTHTEVFLGSVIPYEGSMHSIPLGYGLSPAVGWTDSSSQPSTAESITHWPQRPNTIYANIPLMSYSPKADSSNDMANSTDQLAIEIPTHIPHSSEVGVSEPSLSLASTQLDSDTVAVSLPTETNLSFGQQSSQPEHDLRHHTLTTLPPSLGTTEAYEVSSLATENTWSSTERTKVELKDVTSHRGEERAKTHVDPTYDAISKGISDTISFGMDFISWQPSTAAPLSILHAGNTGTEYKIPLLQDGSLEALTSTPSYWEVVKTGKSAASTVTSASVSSDHPLTTTEATPTLGLDFTLISVPPKAELADQHYTFPQRRHEAMSSPPNSTSLATSRVVLISEEPSGMEVPTKEAPMLLEGTDATHASHLHLDTVVVTLPISPTSPGMARASLHTGGPTASPSMELLIVSSPEWKDGISRPVHAAASFEDITQLEGASVVTTNRTVSTPFVSFDSSQTSIPELTLEMHIGPVEKAQKEQERPEITVVSGLSTADILPPVSKADTSSPASASTLHRMPLLPAEDLDIDLNTSAVTTTLRTELRYKSVSASAAITPLDDGMATLHIVKTAPSGPIPPVTVSVSEIASFPSLPMSSATATPLTSSRFLPDGSKSTCSHISCLIETTPSLSVNPDPAQLSPTSQPLLTGKILVPTSGTADIVKSRVTLGVGDTATSPKEGGARTAAGAERMTLIPGVHSSQKPVSASKGPVLSESATEKNLTFLSTPVLPVPMVHALPLCFRLTGIDYTQSLENKSSESYKKLEKEVKLTVNKMLSTYGSFLQTNILRFLNGSVIVESEAVFQTGAPVPTPSDVIRTIITEIKRWAMDTFFDWRLDIESLRSDEFNWSNLQPEKLAISFTVLGLGPREVLGDMTNWDHLESLKNKVALLIGARYAVQNISLVESGNIQGGMDINGKVYVDSDTHVDIGWVLEALMALSSQSVDLTTLSINGSRLSLQVFPVSFVVTNRIFNEKMMDRSSAEHQNLARDLSDVLTHVLGKYKSLLQVAIREITGGSLVCHGDAIFQHPAPTSKDVLQTLAFAVGPKDYLDSSTLQVDPFSFMVAGDGLDPPSPNLGIPSYAVAILALFILALIALPILVLLPKMLGRRDKIIINSSRDLEAAVEMFELDNPAFCPAVEEVHLDCPNRNVKMLGAGTFRQPQLARSREAFGEGGMMSHSI